MDWDNPPVSWREFERRLSWSGQGSEDGGHGQDSEGNEGNEGSGHCQAGEAAAPVTRLPTRPAGGASRANQATSRADRAEGADQAGPAWAELHCHSSYSFLDGASSPGDLVARAAELGLRALAITDHDGMYGVPQFAQAATRLADGPQARRPRRPGRSLRSGHPGRPRTGAARTPATEAEDCPSP